MHRCVSVGVYKLCSPQSSNSREVVNEDQSNSDTLLSTPQENYKYSDIATC